MSRSAYSYFTCDCGVALTTAGFAVTAHSRGKVHIAWLRAQGRTNDAVRFEHEAADIQANNRRRRENGTYGYKTYARVESKARDILARPGTAEAFARLTDA